MKNTYKEIVRCVPNSDCAFKYIVSSKGITLPVWDTAKNLLLFVLEGKIKITAGDRTTGSLSQGNFMLIPQTEHWKGIGIQDTRMVALLFNRVDNVWTSTKIKKLLDAVEGQKEEGLLTLPFCRPLKIFLDLMVLYAEEKEIDRSFYASKDSELLSLLYAFYSADDVGRMFCPLLHTNLDFKNFVEANYLKVETASELAQLAGCSMVTLNRKFKEYFNDTAYQWIMKNKKVLIKKRLQTPAGTLGEIAKEFGFYSGSELNRFCQRQFGMTALQIRKEATNKSKR